MGPKHPAIELILLLPWNAQDQLTCYTRIHNGSTYKLPCTWCHGQSLLCFYSSVTLNRGVAENESQLDCTTFVEFIS